MSTAEIGVVARQYDKVVAASREIGMMPDNLFMTLSFLSLPVVPARKITDKGLADVADFLFIPLIIT